MLDAALLRDAITAAAQERYNVVSVSGGEPLMYPALGEVLHAAHAAGMITTVTTNGMLLDEKRIGALRGAADMIAISLDGAPDAHNRMRGSPRAFASMFSRLVHLRNAGIPFGFVFTLTRGSLDDLPWVARFAQEQGARLLQVHPLEEVGRAVKVLPGCEPDDEIAAYAWLVVARLAAQYAGQLEIQLDLVDRESLVRDAGSVFADDAANEQEGALADLVSPLVIEADGTVMPLQYGLSHELALGRLQEAPLRELAARWRRERYRDFKDLCRRTFQKLSHSTELPFTNWYREIALHADLKSLGSSRPQTSGSR